MMYILLNYLVSLDNLITNKSLIGNTYLSNFKFKIQDILIQGGIFTLNAVNSGGELIEFPLIEAYKNGYQIYVSPYTVSLSYYSGSYCQSYACYPSTLSTIKCSHSNRERIQLSWIAIGI